MISTSPKETRKRVRSVGAVAPGGEANAYSRRLVIEYRSIDSVKAFERVLRNPAPGQQEHLQRNIRRFGVVVPLLVDKEGKIVAGHAVWAAAKAVGLTELPVVMIDYLSDDEIRALRISLNKIQEMSAWDLDALKSEIAYLQEVNFDLVVNTAYSTVEIDVMVNLPVPEDRPSRLDILPDLVCGPPVSRSGDCWVMKGGHRLACGDARDRSVYERLLGKKRAQMILLDGPFNVPNAGHVTGRLVREFAMAFGEMTKEEFTAFLQAIFALLAEFAVNGSIHLVFIDWRHIDEMSAAGRAIYSSLMNVIAATKTNAGNGSLWRSQHDLVFAWKNGEGPHINNVQLGRNGRWRSNVWRYPSPNVFGRERAEALANHPTPKCVAMFQDAILDVTHQGGIVLDPCVGSGTTLVAAHKCGRVGYGIEIDPLYVDVSVRRMETLTGEPARHAETGRTFAETAAERLGSALAAQA